MKIISLTAENVKRLIAVEIVPNSDVVQITGKNAQGKTSVLDSIWWALAGTKNIQAVPIRKGANSARIRLDLGEIIVTRTFSGKGGSSLTVESTEGAKFASPQTMLDNLLGALSFDPLEFTRQKPMEQLQVLKGMVKLDVDIDALDRENAADYAARTEINRKAKEARARIPGYEPGLPDALVTKTQLMEEWQAAVEFNADLDRQVAARARTTEEVLSKERHVESLKEELAALELKVLELRDTIELATKHAAEFRASATSLPALDAPKDIAALKAKVDEVDALNARIQAKLDTKRLEKEAGELEIKAGELTRAMGQREEKKSAAMAKAKMPVEGLGFGQEGVLYHGVPFEQSSSAEKLKVSMAIAMAANPTLRVVRIQDGSLLDDDSMAQLAQMAAENDTQVWLEKVDSSGKIGFVIEDGMVMAANPAVEPSANIHKSGPTPATVEGCAVFGDAK